MVVYDLETQEAWWGSNDYDDTLRGLDYYLPVELIEVFDKLNYSEEKRAGFEEFMLEALMNTVKVESVCYTPFYNQTIRRYDVRVTFDYSGEITLAEFDEQLSDITLSYSNYVNRVENEFLPSMYIKITEMIENIHTDLIKEIMSPTFDKQGLEKLLPSLSNLNLACRGELKYLTKEYFTTVAELLKETDEYYELSDEEALIADKALENLDARERELYGEVFSI